MVKICQRDLHEIMMTAPGVVMIKICKLQQFSFVVELLFKVAEGGEFTQAHCCNDSSQIGIKSNTFFFFVHVCQFQFVFTVLLPLGIVSSRIHFRSPAP